MFRIIELNYILQNDRLEVSDLIKIFASGCVCFPMIDKIDDLKLWVDPLDYYT